MIQSNRLTFVRITSIAASIAGLIVLGAPVSAQTETEGNRSDPRTAPPSEAAPSPTGNPANNNNAAPVNNTPPANPATTPSNLPANTSSQNLVNLLQQVSRSGSFNTLAQAVQAAGLTDTLRTTGGEFTIFAPTDEAFAALPPGTLQALLRPENRGLLRQVLAYHVVPGEVTSSELTTGGVRTLGGGIAVRVTPDRIVINDGSVIQPDIQAANGVVHVVNRVLLPRELRQRLTNLQASNN